MGADAFHAFGQSGIVFVNQFILKDFLEEIKFKDKKCILVFSFQSSVIGFLITENRKPKTENQ